jgi:hypothetical protein
MTNQQSDQHVQNPSAARVSHAEKMYSFNDLPKDVREKLLQMQNTDGDFLRTGEKASILSNIIILFFLLTIYGGFLSALNFASLKPAKVIVFGVISLFFVYWIAYFCWPLYRTFALPVKDHVYLTRTQIVEIKDGALRFFDLKDVVQMALNKVVYKTMSGGWNYILNFEFADGYFIGCVFPRCWKEPYPEAEQWREKANVWRDEAADAFLRGDVEFFRANDVISKSAIANLPTLKKSSRFYLCRRA